MGLFDIFKKETREQNELTILSPCEGDLVQQEAIPDPVFRDGMMGKAFAVMPESGQVFSPYAGRVVAAMPHAIGIAAADGVELIIHIGIDTVEMQGEGFALAVSKGDSVQAGDLLCEFNRAKVKEAGYSDIVIVALTSTDTLVASGFTPRFSEVEHPSASEPILILSK